MIQTASQAPGFETIVIEDSEGIDDGMYRLAVYYYGGDEGGVVVPSITLHRNGEVIDTIDGNELRFGQVWEAAAFTWQDGDFVGVSRPDIVSQGFVD